MMRPYPVAGQFTPTRVGRRRQRAGIVPLDRRFTHACGESTTYRARHSASQYGSPPRVWGRPDCAPTVEPLAVHPHACGEDERLARLSSTYWEFTPTRVGKTGRPRQLEAVGGSPPRVWGRPSADSANTGSAWFTPTRVGKTPARRATGARSTVHPHACGEDAALVSSSTRMAGSPPRVWGRLVGVDTDSTDQRFTPTRVGKTLRSISCMLGHCCRGACISPRSSLSAPPRRLPRALPSHRWAAAHPTGGTPKPARHGRPACD